jgi:hypothetical protein
VRLALRPSLPLAAAIVAAHAAAAGAVAFLRPDAPGAALAAALVLLGAAAARSRALLRGRQAVRSIELEGGEARCALASGEKVAVSQARRYVSRFVVTLPLPGRTLLVSADMLGPREFRRLRLWALWGKLPAVAAEQLAG